MDRDTGRGIGEERGREIYRKKKEKENGDGRMIHGEEEMESNQK